MWSAPVANRITATESLTQNAFNRLLQQNRHKADITSGLIDYFIGAAEQRRRHGEAEHSGGVRIDDQLELVLFDNWQLRRLGALKDAANIATGLAI